MRLLDRYICREVASHTLLGLVVFTFVFFVPQLVHLMDLIVRHSGGAGTITLLFLCTLPPVLIFTIPMAVLVGVLIGLGRLSSDSEIVALHASGISLRRLLLPIGMIAAVGGFVTLLITFWLSPASLRTLQSMERKIISSQVPFAVEPRVFDERFPHVVLYVQDVSAGATQWHGVFLAASSASTGATITAAENALLITGDDTGSEKSQIDLHLGAGSTHEYDPRDPRRYNVTTFGESDIPLDVSGASAAPQNTKVTPAEQYAPGLLADHGPNWRASRVELQNRMAFPAACLVFALLGVPIGVRPRRGGRAAGMILTIVLIGGYYFLWISGDHFAMQGRVSPWLGVWSADIVAVAVGLLLFRRIETIRDTNRLMAWFGTALAKMKRRKHEAVLTPAAASNGPAGLSNGPVKAIPASNGPISIGGLAAHIRRTTRVGNQLGFPTMVDIYILRQFLYYFVGLLAAFVLIFEAFTLFDLLGDISKNRASLFVVLDYFRFLALPMLYQLVPLATLVATLVTLAVLAKSNEVVAFKASGISLYRLILPLALTGCLLAGGMFLLDDTYLPYANQRQDALRNEIKGRPAQTYFQPTQQWIFGESDKIYNYELFDPDRQLFGGLNVFELDPATFQIRRRVYAARASWEPTESAWILTGGWIRDFNGDGQVSRYYPFKAFSLPELTEPPTYFRREVHQYYQMNWRQLGEYIAGLSQAGFDTARLSVQWHKKFAFPLMAAIIVLLGAPFAFLVGTRGAITGLAVAVGVGVVYWATAALFEAMGSVGQLPPVLAAWSPDVIFGFLAVYFFLRMPT